MINNYFQFKQFQINQDKAAMKVGTDGVLLGAWVDVDDCNEILDIGTGTGLIALMLAQRNSVANITAIDIEKDAVKQAEENFRMSPWLSRLCVKEAALKVFAGNCNKQFDLIICNPPFFKGSLKSNDLKRNLARHSDALPFNQLIEEAYSLNVQNGKFAVILPTDREQEFLSEIRAYNYNLIRRLNVKPTCKKPSVRVLLEFRKGEGTISDEATIVREDKGRHGYSDEYKRLTREFYLSF